MHTDNNDIISYKDEQTMCYLRKFSQKVNEELSIYLFFIGCFDNALTKQKQNFTLSVFIPSNVDI